MLPEDIPVDAGQGFPMELTPGGYNLLDRKNFIRVYSDQNNFSSTLLNVEKAKGGIIFYEDGGAVYL